MPAKRSRPAKSKRRAAPGPKPALTPKQEAFCLAYVLTGNASEAYRRAFNAKRMTQKTVHECASRLLANRNVAARVAKLMLETAEKAMLTKERTLVNVSAIAYSDPRKLFRADGTVIPIYELDPETAAAVASVEVNEITGEGGVVIGRTKKIKFWDKNAALEKAMKHLGMFEKDNSQKPPGPSLEVSFLTPAEAYRKLIEGK